MPKQSNSFPPTPTSRKTDKPWGHEICFTPKQLERVGKTLFVKAGHRLSLQAHTQKEETLCLTDGQAKIWLEDNQGEIKPIKMKKNHGYTVYPGQKHRIEAIKDSLIFEVSSPEEGKTLRLEDDYNRSSEELD